MQRSAIRTLVRKHLQEPAAANWADADLNTLIDLAVALVAKAIRKVLPDAFVSTSTANIVSGTNWYNFPAGCRAIKRVGLLSSGVYGRIERKSQDIAESWTGDTVYCVRGQQIGLFPTPTANLALGIQYEYAPTLSLTQDTDEPVFAAELHLAVVLWATLLAKGESPEDDTKEARQLQQLLADIPEDYGAMNHDSPETLTVDVDRLAGRGGSRLANDVFPAR